MTGLPFDVRAAIARHPWTAIAIAFVAGAGIALGERSRSALIRAAALAAGSGVLAAVRELAVSELAQHARSWLDHRDREYATRATA